MEQLATNPVTVAALEQWGDLVVKIPHRVPTRVATTEFNVQPTVHFYSTLNFGNIRNSHPATGASI
jgi:hypothetical protein